MIAPEYEKMSIDFPQVQCKSLLTIIDGQNKLFSHVVAVVTGVLLQDRR